MKIGLLINGKYKQKDVIDFSDGLSRLHHVVSVSSSLEKSIEQCCDQLINASVEVIVVVGGDGSIHLAINQLYNRGMLENISMAVLPRGTGNDFSRSLGVGYSWMHLLDLINENKTKKIDLGRCIFSDKNGNKCKKVFANIADIGMAAEVVVKIESDKGFLPKALAYSIYGLQTLLNYKGFRANLKQELYEEMDCEFLNISIANGKYFGNGLCISPESKLDDGKLQVVKIGKISAWDYLWNMPKLLSGKKIKHKEVSYDNTLGSITIEPLHQNLVGIEMDGEFAGFLPAEFSVLPEKLTIYSK